MYIRPELSPSSDSEAFFTQLTHFNTLLSELDAHLASAMRARAATAESASDSNAATLERCEAAVSSTRRECARELTALQRLATDAARRAQFATSASGLQDRLRAQAAAENAAAKEGRARAARQYRIVHPAASAAEAERAVSADTQVFAAALNVDKAKVSSVAREVQRRHEEIVRLEKSMLELAQMLAEVAELVRMQDDMVREVEENAEDLDRDLEKA
jgi:syntaxin 1B/2/3